VNQGVIEAHRRGIVSSATLMVGFPAARQAVELARDCPALGLGLHLALTGAPALAPHSGLDEAGRLPARPAALHAADPAELRRECLAQLERFRELVGRDPTHLDTHHHSHRLPAVLEVVLEIASAERLPVRLAAPELDLAGIRTTDAFVEDFHGAGATLSGLLAILGALRPGVTELMCHPAIVDDELRSGSSYAEERQRELAILTSPQARAATAALRLVTFADLR
jgi:predicted glycoside hydrolase/deacetylase ChbG (UPF0249 family)